MKHFSIVVAATSSTFGIGRKGDLPWKLAEDMAFFKKVTSTAVENKMNAVIMGRKTYESIPEKFRPLSDRVNIILSRDTNIRQSMALPDSVLVAGSFEDALKSLSGAEYADLVQNVFVIGGGSVYDEALRSPYCSKIYLTEVHAEFEDLDTFFPTIAAHKFRMVSRSKLQQSKAGLSFRFTEYNRLCDEDVFEAAASAMTETAPLPAPPAEGNKEEQQYLDIVRDILDHGVLRGDRTGTGTLSKFGVQMRFNLRNNVFPLLTTKRVFWRGVAEELVWFVRGCTNGNLLAEKDIHIWDGNGSREFLDSRGLGHREVGDLGPVYGFQWRHFGAEYTDMHADYTGKGVDQLLDCIHKLKTTPEDRRIVLTAWNPADLDKMALPPCHMFCQFYVANGELSCQMYQRSADMGLGVPFNIASYSLLTAMVAQACNLRTGDFVHTIGDAHVYVNHVEALREQLLRTPRAFPKLFLNPEVTDIDAFQFSDFTIEGYKPDGAIKMKMAV